MKGAADSPKRDPEVARAFAESHGGAVPDPQWQARVWARIARAPEERRERVFRWGWAGALCSLAILVVASGYWSFRVSQENEEIQASAKASLEKYQKEVAGIQADIEALIKSMDSAAEKRLAAGTEEERVAADAERKALERLLKTKRDALKQLRKQQAKKEAVRREKAKRVNVKCDPNDPLCGL